MARIVVLLRVRVPMLLLLIPALQVPCELRLPDLNESKKVGVSLEQQLRTEAEDLLVMQAMARNNQRLVVAIQ